MEIAATLILVSLECVIYSFIILIVLQKNIIKILKILIMFLKVEISEKLTRNTCGDKLVAQIPLTFFVCVCVISFLTSQFLFFVHDRQVLSNYKFK